MVVNLKIKRSYLFFPDKEKEGDGYKPDAKLRLRVRWSGRKVDFNVGYRIKLSQWDTQTQRCRVKTTNLQKQSATLINGAIQAFETAIDNVFTSFELEGISPAPDQVRVKFNLLAGRTNSTEVHTDKTLFDYFDDFTREMGNINSWTSATYTKFAAVRHHLETFNASLQFADLTEFGLTQYVNYLREVKGMRNTTITKQLGFLKWFLRWATTKGYCQTRDYINFKPKLKTSEKKIIFLDWPKLMTIYNYPFTDKQKTLERETKRTAIEAENAATKAVRIRSADTYWPPKLSPITATSSQVSTSETNRVTEVTTKNKLFPNAVIDVSGWLWMKARANFRITYNKKRQG